MQRPSARSRDLVHTPAPRIYQGRDDIDTVFRKVELITSVGAMIGTLEQLATSGTLADDNLFAWPVIRLSTPDWWRRAGSGHLDRIFGYPHPIALVQTRALAGLSLVLPGVTRAQRGALATAMCGTAYGLQSRVGGYGLDGSDHMAFVNYAAAAIEKFFSGDPRAREAAVWFLAGQACLSYFTSGAAKIVSPEWRDGSAIPSIFRTVTYGDPFFYRVVGDHPWLAKTIAWTTILGEVTFPLVLVAPRPVARGIMAGGAAFHLANARFMGLNRFFWSFCATYPAVAYASRSLGPGSAARPARASARASVRDLTGSLARSGRTRATALAAAGTAVVAGGAVRRMARARRARLRASAPGELVRIGEDEVHLLSASRGAGPTVVFENGTASPATEWGWVLEGLGAGIPHLAYDRPGIGWSAATRGPQDAESVTARLMRLLIELGCEPPYVLVGHSVGGLLIRCFARRHPEMVGGLVFVDSSHPGQFDRSPKQRDMMPWIEQEMGTRALKATVGLLRPDSESLKSLPPGLRTVTTDCLRHPGTWRAARHELIQMRRSWLADAAAMTPRSTLPVAVLTAGHTARNDPEHAGLQRELADLSAVSRHEVVEEADHSSLVMAQEHAPAIVKSIEWVLSSQARPSQVPSYEVLSDEVPSDQGDLRDHQ